ncbi:hypothetical protein [Poseidonibacter lekithochrous]|uniref:hypothetical protein n=1 Tax=Poseidonibacter lekithochrous TaxID=1904463 RepID=UPI000D37C49D|nr:hypothetical protein [Poseidonibacter lekithochrous]
MTFSDMTENDLAACSEFGGECTHHLDGVPVPLNYLWFDESTDMIFDSANDDFSSSTVGVPAVYFQTSVSTIISTKSFLEIDEKLFGVVDIQKMKDNTTVVYLDSSNG